MAASRTAHCSDAARIVTAGRRLDACELAGHKSLMTVHHPDLRATPALALLPKENEAGGILTVDLGAIEANWKLLASMTLPVECAAVVKANAYGCGLEPVTRKLAKAGCRTFFVADFTEARSVRAIAADATIYVLGGMMPGSPQACAEGSFRPVLNSVTEFAEWDAFVTQTGWRGGAALHVDTGMNRLGITVQEAIAIAPRIQSENHGLTLLMSHLACAETPDHPMNDRQIRSFREIRILFRGFRRRLPTPRVFSLAARCSAIWCGRGLRYTGPTRHRGRRTRCGLQSTQGAHPPGAQDRARGNCRLWRQLDGNTSLPHRSGRSRLCRRIFAVSRRLQRQARGQVIIAGQRCPLVGRVSMDLFAADVTDLSEGAARRGDFAVLIGTGISVDDLAQGMGTISYEVLSNLGRRYHRVYRGV